MVNISGEPFCRPSFGPIDIFFLSLLWRGGGGVLFLSLPSYHPRRAWSFGERGQDGETPSLQRGMGDDFHG